MADFTNTAPAYDPLAYWKAHYAVGFSGTKPGDPGTYQGGDGIWYDSAGQQISFNNTAADPRTVQRTPGPAVTQGPGTAPEGNGSDSAFSPTDWATLQQSIFGQMPSVSQFTPPPFSYDAFTAPAPFAPPSANDVLFADPGYGFRRDQGLQAMQNSAAARGVLNTGGTLQDLIDYGGKSASQEYGNAFDRALGTYDENYRNSLNSYITNFGNALTKYNTNYGTQYLTPYNQLMGKYGTGMQGQQQLFGQQFQTATA